MQEALPGEAVHITGFKHVPEVGRPLYAVKTHDDAVFISERIKRRREREAAMQTKELSDRAHDLQKQVHGLGHIEKGKIYSGDRVPMYERLNLLEEEDLERYRRKLHIKDDVDLTNLTQNEIDHLIEKSTRKRGKPSMQAKKQFEIEEFKKIVSEYREERAKVESMNPLEREKYQAERE